MVSMTLWLLTDWCRCRFFLGDAHGLNTLEYQPAKLAAIEARWETGRAFRSMLFAIPDEKAETNNYVIAIPDLGSLILTHELNGEVKGLKDFPADQRPRRSRFPSSLSGSWWDAAVMMLGARAARRMAALAGRADRTPLFLLLLHAAHAYRLHGGDRRLGDHRSRASAVDGLWAVANGRFRVAVVDRLDVRFRWSAIGRLPLHVSRAWISRSCCRVGPSGPPSGSSPTIEAAWPKQPVLAIRSTATGRDDDLSPFSIRARLDADPGRAAFFYVLLDGFDLGVGILYGFAPDAIRRNTIMNSIAPIWDGNETWLVLGGTWPVGGLPARIRHHHSRGLFSDPRHAAGAHIPRRRLRVPLSRRRTRTFWDHAFNYGSGHWRPSRKAWCSALHSGIPDGRSRVRRRLVRLLDTVFAADRRRSGVRLQAARRGLADSEDRRPASGVGAGSSGAGR